MMTNDVIKSLRPSPDFLATVGIGALNFVPVSPSFMLHIIERYPDVVGRLASTASLTISLLLAAIVISYAFGLFLTKFAEELVRFGGSGQKRSENSIQDIELYRWIFSDGNEGVALYFNEAKMACWTLCGGGLALFCGGLASFLLLINPDSVIVRELRPNLLFGISIPSLLIGLGLAFGGYYVSNPLYKQMYLLMEHDRLKDKNSR